MIDADLIFAAGQTDAAAALRYWFFRLEIERHAADGDPERMAAFRAAPNAAMAATWVLDDGAEHEVIVAAGQAMLDRLELAAQALTLAANELGADVVPHKDPETVALVAVALTFGARMLVGPEAGDVA